MKRYVQTTKSRHVINGKIMNKGGEAVELNDDELKTLAACGIKVIEEGKADPDDVRAQLAKLEEERDRLKAKLGEVDPDALAEVEEQDGEQPDEEEEVVEEEVTLPTYQEQVSALSAIDKLPKERSKPVIRDAYVEHVLGAEVA